MANATRRETLRAALSDLCARVPTAGTRLLGEHYRTRGGVATNLNDMPHVWQHSLVYLAAMRLWPQPRPRSQILSLG